MAIPEFLGKQVRVYYNLHKGCLSIQVYIQGKGWRVKGYANSLILQDVVYQVFETSRLRAIKQRRRNVHAYACGTLIGVSNSINKSIVSFDDDLKSISYNPYNIGSFYFTSNQRPLKASPFCIFWNSKPYVCSFLKPIFNFNLCKSDMVKVTEFSS